jgi:hypothetical protein
MMPREQEGRKASRRSGVAFVATYHQEKLTGLLDHVREGLAAYEAGEIDAFQVDAIIHQYTKAARELWKFCDVSGSRLDIAVRAIQLSREDGSERDWWEAGASARPRQI